MTMDLKFIRSLSPAMAKVLLVFLFERGGMTIDELASRTGLNDRHTLYRACHDLADPSYGMLVKQTGAHGKDTWLPAGALLPMIRGAYFADPDGGNSTTWIETGPAQQIQMVENPPSGFKENRSGGGISTTCAPKKPQMVEIPPPETGSIRLIEEDSLNINDKDLLQSEPEKSDLPPVEKLLEAMSVLRGRKGNPDFPWESPGAADIPRGTSPRLCLAWIVKSYCDREGLRNPVGVICARLRARTARSLPKNWQERLPAEFLAEIGIEPEVSEPVDRVTQAVEEFLRRR